MAEFSSIEKLAEHIKKELDVVTTKKKIMAIYAFNTTGKTRLSTMIEEKESSSEEESDTMSILCYNAFFEDIFTWDNEKCVFTFRPHFWIFAFIVEQGLEDKIVQNFRDIIRVSIEPYFDFENGNVSFNIVSGDNQSEENKNIKISRGEESMFVWSIFYTVLEAALDELETKEKERSTTYLTT